MVAFLPSSVAKRLVTIGKYGTADDKLDTNWTAVATVDRELRWVATGDVIEQLNMPILVDTTGVGQIRLPVTDQDGFVDKSGSAVKNWYYTITFGGDLAGKKQKVFQLPSSSGDFDADNVNDSTASPPPTDPTTTYVNSVTIAGVTQSGAVDLTSLVTGAGGPIGSTTVQGISDAKTVGKSLLLAADVNAAQTVLQLDQVDNTADANKPMSAAVAIALNSYVRSADFAAAVAGFVTSTALANGLAGKLDKTTKVALYAKKTGSTWDPRPITAAGVPVFWLSPDGSNPPGGGTVGGGAGVVDGTDVVLLGGS